MIEYTKKGFRAQGRETITRKEDRTHRESKDKSYIGHNEGQKEKDKQVRKEVRNKEKEERIKQSKDIRKRQH